MLQGTISTLKFKAMNKIVSFFCLFLILSGCKKSKYELEENLLTYRVNIEEKQKVSVFDLFSDIEIIPLETKQEALIAWGIPQIYKNQIYVLEDRQNIVLCFDLQGKWQFNINNRGRAGNEYQSLQSIAFDPFNDQLLLHDFFGPIHEYNLKGQFLKKFHCKELLSIYNVNAINRDTLVLYDLHNSPKLHFYSRQNNKILKSLWNEHALLSSTPNFYFYNDSLYFFSSCYGNITYNLTDMRLTPIYQWDFGKYNYNASLLTLPQVSEKKWQGEMEIKWRQRHCPYNFVCGYENNLFIYRLLNLNYEADFDKDIPAQQKHLFYNKQNHTYFLFNDFEEKIDFGTVIAMDEEYLYAKVTNYSKNLILESHILPQTEQQKLLNIKADDNYPIIKFKFKKSLK